LDDTAALVARARAGEPKAFEVLTRRHLRAAYAVALAVLGSPADAEDVAQEGFVVAFGRLETCREPARFTGWLLQIVRNRARNAVDTRRVRAQLLWTSDAHVPPAEERLQARGQLLEALALISDAQREVVLLHDLDGWTHVEIATVLGISEVMSRQHLFTARRTMRGHLQTEERKELPHGR
jgi:RNA polymerase sigma-70 factor (ECF subfamily)